MPTLHADVAAGAPAELLSDYQPGDFFLSSPAGVVLADEPSAVHTTIAAAKQALASGGVVAGAVPFARTAPARLGFYRSVRHGQPWHRETAALTALDRPNFTGGDHSQEVYLAGVRAALDRIHTGDLSKVVLARVLDLHADRPVLSANLLQGLMARDPYGYTFAADVGAGSLVGASPELLVSRRKGLVTANPLAGSAPRHADPVQDGRNATGLLVSDKDRHEHAVVVTAVAEGLSPLCKRVVVPPTPELLPTRTMWHLSTLITAEPLDGVSALDLALALHPTPAVCGTPTEPARALIGELEPFDRGFYTGLVGWTDAAGDGEWAIALRCAVIDETSLRLYAGAGIVAGSDPDKELAETTAKFRTFLDAIGLGDLT
nr:isochorismate synthase [Kibdelosporangium sp. MJ126-NF4]CEL19998.1 Isochorismate synthase of siderophore biosynthesis [Kibdelosporangium sp. MJ126-NF4]CTQ97222.1 Isochorismate synthase (EC 5.4.4.2) of siderophore biosynthesis [Kibdelosporangium sp. MJ126-NF4]